MHYSHIRWLIVCVLSVLQVLRDDDKIHGEAGDGIQNGAYSQ